MNNTNSYDPNNAQQTLYAFDNILQETALKVGCCKRSSYDDYTSQTAKVRVPVHPSVSSEYGFQYKQINIPGGQNSCPVYYYAGSQLCDAFYDVYCQNIFNAFSETKLPADQLLNYAPECACFIPNTKQQSYLPPGIPPACYKKGCSPIDNNVYLDSNSRQNPCSSEICQNLTSVLDVHAEGNVDINAELKNTCNEHIIPALIPVHPIMNNQVTSQLNNLYIILIVIVLLCFCSVFIYKNKFKKK